MGLIVMILLVMFGPPILFTVIGSNQSDKKRAKVYYIVAVVYLLIGLGICGSLLYSLTNSFNH
ncbi:MAG: hypothetical protein R2797_02025 [Gelidibacter sp.]